MARKGRDRDEDYQPYGERPRRGRKLVLPVMLLILAGVVWFLPAIITRSSALNWIVARAAADLNGSAEVGSATLGWFSPITVTDVRIRDAAGQPVAEVPRVVGERRLWDLVWRPGDLGQFKIDRPHLTVVLRDGTSNVEQLLQKYLSNTQPSRRSQSLGLEVTDGQVEIRDTAGNRSWQIDKVSLRAKVPATGAGPIELSTSGAIGGSNGRLSAECKLPDAGGPDLTMEIQSAPLDILTPIAERFLPGTRLTGRASGNVRLAGNSTRGSLVADEFQAVAAVLSDPVQLRQLKGEWDLAWPGQEMAVKKLAAECELGQVSLAGTFSRVEFTPDKLLASLRKQSFEAAGRVDLARLAASLPKTLRIRQNTQVTSGQLELAVSGRPDSKGAAWQGHLKAAELKALVEGRPIAWQQPMAINFSLRDAAGGITVEMLKCESSFLTVEAQGRPEELAAAARFDLGQLASQLGQFVDLGGLRTAGEGWAYLNWKSPDRKTFSADLELQARDFRLALPNLPPWEEPNLVLFLAAAGQMTGGVPVRLESASLRAKAAPDELEAKLLEPVADWRTAASWPVEARMQGRLEAWAPRLRNFVDLGPWKAAGAYDLSARGAFSATQVALEQAQLTAKELSVTGPGVAIADPAAQVSAAGQWDRAKGQLKIRSGTLQSSAVAIAANDLCIDLPPQNFRAAGAVKYQGQLERLRQWFPSAAGQAGYSIAGRVSGTGNVEQSGATVRGALDATIENLLVADSFGQRFGEPQVRLALRGDYDRATGLVQLQQCSVAAASLMLEAGGRVSGTGFQPVSGTPDRRTADLTGTAQYDLQRLTDLARPWIPGGIRLAGQGKDPFWIRGPLTAGEAQAEATVKWTSGYLYGFEAGEGQLKARLAGGVVRCEPIACTLSEGKLRISPQVRLAPEPAEVTAEAGLVAEQIRINPTMCHYALSYAVPALAGVATAEGRFSLQLERCRLPLADPGRGELGGKLVIHAVEITPGPLVEQLVAAVGRGSTAKLARESTIPFAMRDRRIYHEGMELVFPEVTVRTKGSVGLDRTLSLVASMPVPEKWIGQNPLGTALKNQTIELPVAGTLEQPQLDRRGLESFTQRAVGTAARNLFEDHLKQQFDRLLPKQ